MPEIDQAYEKSIRMNQLNKQEEQTNESYHMGIRRNKVTEKYITQVIKEGIKESGFKKQH